MEERPLPALGGVPLGRPVPHRPHEPGVAYPLNWLPALFPLEHGYISLTLLNWYFIVIHYMGAAFCYGLCRDLKCRRAPSLLAGVSFALGGYIGNNN
jgi:hypothetical protein